MSVLRILVYACLVTLQAAAHKRDVFDKPNIVWIVADDLGYGDLASYGHPTQEYGGVDAMAQKGLRFTQAYVPDTLCTPSRAAFLTGRYPARLGMYGSKKRVLLPFNPNGLNRSEIIVPEALKSAGYTTGMVGKWHLGINRTPNMDGYYLPSNHGFDFVGINHPNTNNHKCEETIREPAVERCFIYRGDHIVSQPFRHDNLTDMMVQDAVGFFERNKRRPFFFYMALFQPHVPLRVNPRFHLSSRRGRIGDNLNEMNWAVSEVNSALKRLRIHKNTLVIFHSDHGPQAEFCAEGGNAGILSGYKTNSWEGGVRVPFITYWPGVIKPGVSREVITSLDLFPTFVNLTGGTMPTDRAYDGLNIRDTLLYGAASPHGALFFYCADRLMAVRYGNYKLHFHTHRLRTPSFFAIDGVCGNGGEATGQFYLDCVNCRGDCISDHDPPLVFDVEKDPSEIYALNITETPGLAFVVETVAEHVRAHEETMTVAPPLFDEVDRSVVPCCNPPHCRCNYTPPPPEWDY
ncbi:arylsulfatase-like [Diadema antillarum]|uniref:arylsulfatase-like n=1 Tax=Diadema antillarum TaxID=105358 RepID=UPI003A8A0EA6